MQIHKLAPKLKFFRQSISGIAVVIAATFAGFAAPLYASTPAPGMTSRLVGYLPDYKGVAWAGYASSIDLVKMTHLNLAFGNPPKCNGTCTASSDMTFSLKGQSDADVDAVVAAAHAAGVKVLLSIGGGGGDQLILQFYNAGLSVPLVNSLDQYLKAHKIDGVDVDIEDPSNMGAPFADFVTTLVLKLHPQGKLVTAAVAPYLQASMPGAALHQFDFINVMNYSSLAAATTAVEYYANQCHVPKDRIVLGVPFFGSASDDSKEEDYKTILAAYPNAWQVDMVGGGSLDNGKAFKYAGEATMAQETLLGKQYGGVMIWEMMGDAAAPHSLLTIIQNNL
jgi:GH18 family chitinase